MKCTMCDPTGLGRKGQPEAQDQRRDRIRGDVKTIPSSEKPLMNALVALLQDIVIKRRTSV
jgi:hypothetical protein